VCLSPAPPQSPASPLFNLSTGELSIQLSLNAILILPHLRSLEGSTTLTLSSQALTDTQTSSDWQPAEPTPALNNFLRAPPPSLPCPSGSLKWGWEGRP
jgi:hypothetical protein